MLAYQPNPRQQSTTMSWVRQAIDDVKAQSYEELYPTGYGGSSEKPDVSPTTLTLSHHLADHGTMRP